jgi:glycosyltransferase involved in cell wall biosynthesis
LRIGVSAFAADSGKSGIGRYMVNILQRLPDLTPDDHFVVFTTRADQELFARADDGVEIRTSPDWCGHPLANIFWHVLSLPLLLRRHRCELVFLPAGNRRLAWWYGVPSLATVHDLAQLHVPQKYDRLRMFYITRVLPRMMRRLTRIIAVSESTRSDLETYVKVPAERVDLIPNGADLCRFFPRDRQAAKAEVRARLGLPENLVLYVSRLEHPGKNHVRLLEAFARLLSQTGRPYKLALAGGRWNGAEVIEAKVAELGLEEQVVFLGFVPDETLPLLYAASDIMVFPSLFEGFGIPLLEAMASGTPVCASNVSSIPEVVGDAGLLFDPMDPAAIADAMARLLEDRELRDRLVERGLARARQFTWDRSAAMHVESMRRTVEGRPRGSRPEAEATSSRMTTPAGRQPDADMSSRRNH